MPEASSQIGHKILQLKDETARDGNDAGPFMRGQTVGIKKRVHDKARPGQSKDVTIPAFGYEPTDGLAQVILDAWSNPGSLLQRDNQGNPTQAAVNEATAKINNAGFDLKRAVIITEEEHDNDYTMQDPDEVVFVLPNKSRAVPATHLLQTAKLLMACTPNGI